MTAAVDRQGWSATSETELSAKEHANVALSPILNGQKWPATSEPELYVPELMLTLLRTDSRERASDVALLLEEAVATKFMEPRAGAPELCALLVPGLLVASSVGRIEMMHVLQDLCSGVDTEFASGSLDASVAIEVTRGFVVYAWYVQTGTPEERFASLDLCFEAARFDAHLRTRVENVFRSVLESGVLAGTELEFARSSLAKLESADALG